MTEPTGQRTMLSCSLYQRDAQQLVAFIASAQTYASSLGEKFSGISIDLDSDGNLTLHAVGIRPLTL